MLYSSAAYNAIKHGSPASAGPLLEQAIPLAHELEDPPMLAFLHGNVGFVALLTDDLDRARRAFEEQIRVGREHVLYIFAAAGLAGLAAIATKQGDPGRAARLLGAATATGPWDADADVKAETDQRFFTDARISFGEQCWDDAYAAGTRLSFEEAIDYALDPASTRDLQANDRPS